MRKPYRFVTVIVAFLVVGAGAWLTQTSHASLQSAAALVQVDPWPMMVRARHLPTQRLTDFTFVFIAERL